MKTSKNHIKPQPEATHDDEGRPLGGCLNGGQHLWGTDGQHSNIFCKDCFTTLEAAKSQPLKPQPNDNVLTLEIDAQRKLIKRLRHALAETLGYLNDIDDVKLGSDNKWHWTADGEHIISQEELQ